MDYSTRFKPDFRYQKEKTIEVSLDNFKSTEPSVTDKEAYRLTLASLRGEMAQGAGKIDQGQYSLQPGKEYNPDEDFSFLNRKDVTIVQIDEYINNFRERVENYDSELVKEIELQLQAKKESLEKSQTDEKTKLE